MKRVYMVTLLSALAVLLAVAGIYKLAWKEEQNRTVRVGFVYVGDASNAYTCNFLKAETALVEKYGERVEIISKFNVAEGNEKEALQELVDAGCELIVSTSYGYGVSVKEMAMKYPSVQFCQATCTNANETPVLDNYHTFMGAIYQGRYISGVVAGMKLKELIDDNVITAEQAKVGYVAAYPYAEVISGYTAFFLGVRSVVPEAEMLVKYTDTWSSYVIEKDCAKQLIAEGCVIISQHSDTTGPAVACEEIGHMQAVYHVGYNQGMADVAPSAYLCGSRINWTPYILSAVQALFQEKRIEACVDGKINGNDAGAGFDEGWVKMLELNQSVVADGTQEKVDALIEVFRKNEIQVYKGNYTGVNPFDAADTIDLRKGYEENKNSSAPTFHYVLQEVITILE